ncbi:MAG: hypothetical protein ACKORK_01025, partial [Gemmatimonadota bacterium]
MGVRIGVIGATGLVGQEMLRLIAERDFPADEVRAYASPRSEGRVLTSGEREITCEVLRDGCFDAPDLVILDLQIANQGGIATAIDLRLEAAAGRLPDLPVLLLLDREADRHIAQRAD